MVVIFKLPFVVSTVLTGLLIYGLLQAKWKNRDLAVAGLFMWLLNPYVWSVAVMDGTMDIVAVMFVTLSMYLFIKGHYEASTIPLAIGVAFRFYPILLVPFFLVSLLREGKRLRSILFAASLATVLAAFTMPFVARFGQSFYGDLVGLLQSGWGEFLWFFGHTTGEISFVVVIYFLTWIVALDKWRTNRFQIIDASTIVLTTFVIFAHWNWYYPLWVVPLLTIRYFDSGRFRWSIPLFMLSLIAVIGATLGIVDFYFYKGLVDGNVWLNRLYELMSSVIYQSSGMSVLAVTGLIIIFQTYISNHVPEVFRTFCAKHGMSIGSFGFPLQVLKPNDQEASRHLIALT